MPALAMLLLAAPAWAEDAAPAPGDLLKAGRFNDAYQRAAAAPDAAAQIPALAQAMLEQLLASPDSFQRWYGLRATRTLTDAALVPSLRKMAREGDRYEQSLALDALTLSAPEAARDEFIHALSSPYRPVRLRGLRGLSRHPEPALVPPFSTTLSNDTDPDIRALAARALGETGSAAAIPALQHALGDSSEVVQEEAVRALARLGDATVGGALRSRLTDEPDIEVRVRLIRLMGFVPDPQMIGALGPLLADGDPEVRAYAAAAITRVQLALTAAAAATPGKP